VGAPIPTSTSCTGFTPAPAQGCAEAGYQASGRDFRYAQAVITVPDHHGVVTACPPGARCAITASPAAPGGAIRDIPDDGEADPQLYVALDGSSTGNPQFARVGVQPCTGGTPCGSSGWEAFAEVKSGLQPPISPPSFLFPIAAADEGDAVFVSVYLDPAGQAVHTVITLPDGSTFNNTFAANGMVFPRAQAAAALVLAVLVALAVTIAFILVIGLAIASAAPGRAPGYIPVRENPAVAFAGRRWAGSTISVAQPALPAGSASLTR
jgi:hypothetical protein